MHLSLEVEFLQIIIKQQKYFFLLFLEVSFHLMAPETDKWAIDQTVLEYDGQLYAIWSGWEGDENVDQRIYIARMDNPWTISGERVELSMPEYSWEKQGGTPTINEGPQIAVSPDGTVNIVYSASGSWSDYYCLGCLTLKDGADPMEKESWTKADQPIFEKNNSTTYSTELRSAI